MDVIERIELKAKKAAELVQFELRYVPGITEDLDQYQALNERLGVSCYGSSEEKALQSARMEAEARFMEMPSKADAFLSLLKEQRKKK